MYLNKRIFAISSPQLYLNELTKQKTNNNRGMCVFAEQNKQFSQHENVINAVKMLKFNIDV